MNFKKAHIVVVIVLIMQMIFYGFTAMDTSTYGKYASGEYYFRARAKTTQPDDSLLFDTTLDMSQTKNILLLSSGAEVYAYNPHGPYCTVEYGDEVVQDFPLTRLKFLTDDDKDVFNGKKYTEEEYNALIERMLADPSMQDMLSDKAMIPSKSNYSFPLIVILVSVTMAVVLYLVREDGITKEIILTVWVLLSILFDIFYANTTLL